MKSSFRFGFILPLAVASIASSSCFAQALPPASGAETDEATATDIVVTATKRQERLIDVPISIATMSGEELKNRQINSMEDLAQVVPSLSFNSMGSNRYYSIRGISNLIGNSPLVGIYLDEADVTLGGAAATQINPTVYDIERVEVLRGPQGTLYGQGSAGGTIKFVTRKPELDRLGLGADVSALFTKNGSPSTRINAMANIPLIDDVLGVRIVGTFQNDGGWIDQPALDRRNINSSEIANLRVKALWKITPDFTANAMVIINRSEQGNDYSDIDSPGSFTQVFNQATTPRVTSDYDLYNLTLDYDFGAVNLTNTTTFLKVFSEYENQSSLYPLTPPDVLPPFHYYAPVQQTYDRQLTNELRLSSTGGGPWRWTVGAFYRHFRDKTDIPLNYFDQPSGTTLPEPYAFGVTTIYDSGSVFLDTSYDLSDRFTIGGGIRYFEDHQDFTDRVAGAGGKDKFTSVDPRVYAQFKLNRRAMIYASAAKGFRSGGFNKGNQPSYDPESVWTYELGAKAELLNGALAFDAAVFLSDYTDYQIFGITDASDGRNFVSNIGSARVKGVEWDITLRPTKQLRLDVRGNFVDTKFTKINATGTAFLVGDRLNLIPRYDLSVSAQYDFALGDRDGFVRVDYSQVGRKVQRDRSVGEFYIGKSDTIGMLNFNAGIDVSDQFSVGAFVQNITNEQGYANPFAFLGSGVRPRPRTFGFNISAKM